MVNKTINYIAADAILLLNDNPQLENEILLVKLKLLKVICY